MTSYEQRKSILDGEIPEIDSPVLRPTRYVKSPEPPEEKDIKQEIRELEEMLGLRKKASVAPQIKVSDPEEVEPQVKIKRIKEIQSRQPQFRVTKSASTLGGFARQFRIWGPSLSDPREFMQMVRNQVLNFL